MLENGLTNRLKSNGLNSKWNRISKSSSIGRTPGIKPELGPKKIPNWSSGPIVPEKKSPWKAKPGMKIDGKISAGADRKPSIKIGKSTKLYSSLYSEADIINELIERAFCDGYEYAQKEFDEKKSNWLSEKWQQGKKWLNADTDKDREKRNKYAQEELEKIKKDSDLYNRLTSETAINAYNNSVKKRKVKGAKSLTLGEDFFKLSKEEQNRRTNNLRNKSIDYFSSLKQGPNSKKGKIDVKSAFDKATDSILLNTAKNNKQDSTAASRKAIAGGTAAIAVAGTTLAAIKAAKKRKAKKEAARRRREVMDEFED